MLSVFLPSEFEYNLNSRKVKKKQNIIFCGKVSFSKFIYHVCFAEKSFLRFCPSFFIAGMFMSVCVQPTFFQSEKVFYCFSKKKGKVFNPNINQLLSQLL